ncbi:LysE family translocator [Undibacterium sp. Di24W]|uniref:LysE family translocator n=1 Tax=Undibacterium sp. Di24W TaxID=3413033 RepID=UPI003BF0C5E2
MSGTSNLWLYFLVISGVIILPGMDMAYVMGSSMKGGYRAGFAAVAGTMVGGIFHMIIGATGVSAVLTLIPWAYHTMLIAGAAYVAWLGWGLIQVNALASLDARHGTANLQKSFMGAVATCMLNPKAYIFMLAIFPQFIRRDGDSIWIQTSVLSLITAGTQLIVYGTVAIMAVQAQHVLANKPRTNAILAKGIGVLLIAAAILTLYSGLMRA